VKSRFGRSRWHGGRLRVPDAGRIGDSRPVSAGQLEEPSPLRYDEARSATRIMAKCTNYFLLNAASGKAFRAKID
jgi:hypothetical protein